MCAVRPNKSMNFYTTRRLDQIISESQFESYRGLGFYIMDMISSPQDEASPPNRADLFR